MALATRVSTSAVSAGLTSILALLSSGAVLKVYSSNQPATPDVLPGAGHDLLATLAFSSTPFGAAVAGGAYPAEPHGAVVDNQGYVGPGLHVV